MNEWQSAYSTMAEVAATLSGLLFVSLSMKLNAATGEHRGLMVLVAKRSFFDFLAVLGIALLLLIPGGSLAFVGWTALLIATARVVWHVQHWRSYRSAEAVKTSLIDYFVPMVATLMLGSAGLALLLSSTLSPKLIYAAAIALLYGACQNAWRFLIQ